MKKAAILFSLIFICVSTFTARAQHVENVRVKQLNNKINLIYDITKEKIGQQFNVQVFYSKDAGKTYKGPIDSLTGAFGKNIKGGTNQLIVWDVLSEVPNLIGENIVFKIKATPTEKIIPEDKLGDFIFKLKSLKPAGDKFKGTLTIKNTSDKKDIRIPNRLSRLYDYQDKRLEAKQAVVGNVKGMERHSQPQTTLKKNQEIEATFYFNAPQYSIDRFKMFQLGFDILEISYGLDVTPGKIEFRDIPLEKTGYKAITEASSKPKEIKIGEKIIQQEDHNPPEIAIEKPVYKKDEPIIVTDNKFKIKGKITDKSDIFDFTINNISIDLDQQGSFSSSLSLENGFNDIILHASDIRGNSKEKKITVIYMAEEEASKDKLRDIVKKENEKYSDLRESKNFALLIGVNDYDDPLITNLDNPYKDANKLSSTLINHYAFEKEHVSLLNSPTRKEIMIELDKLNNSLSENDNLLIFYAGHGYWDTENKVGYWLPSDSKSDNTVNWFRNSTLTEYVRSIDARHTLIIADACFSGSIFKTRKAFADAPEEIQNLYKLPSRKAMTSGSLKEVPDQSVFLKYMVKRLKENEKRYITAEELFNSFKVAVVNNSPNTPLYGEVKNSGDEGGDFIFVKKKDH